MKTHASLLLRLVAVVMAFALALLLAYALIRHFENKPDSGEGSEGLNFRVENLVWNGETYSYNHNVRLILLLGIDTAGVAAESDYYLTGGQADVIFLAAIDDELQEVRLLQLDRDTLCRVHTFGIYGEPTDTITAQLALSYAYGNGGKISMNNTVRSVKELLGVPISACVALTMGSMETWIGQVGSVQVSLPCDCSWLDPTYTTGAVVHLQGETAIRYLRGRTETESGKNRDRMLRHRAYLPAFLKTAAAEFSAGVLSFDRIWEEISPYLVTDLTQTEVFDLFVKIKNYQIMQPQTPDGVSDDSGRFTTFTISPESLKKQVIDLCYQKAVSNNNE